jgi:hypothetical protein
MQFPDLRDEALCYESNASQACHAICRPAMIIRRNVERLACRRGDYCSSQTVCLIWNRNQDPPIFLFAEFCTQFYIKSR